MQSTRSFAPDNSYLVILSLARENDDLLIRQIEPLRRAMRDTLRLRPFSIHAIAVLPAALHAIWTLPVGDTTCAARANLLKRRFAHRLDDCPSEKAPSPDGPLWQENHLQRKLTGSDELRRQVDQIHLAPVYAGLCRHPQDWSHTSLHRDILRGGTAPKVPAPGPENPTVWHLDIRPAPLSGMVLY